MNYGGLKEGEFCFISKAVKLKLQELKLQELELQELELQKIKPQEKNLQEIRLRELKIQELKSPDSKKYTLQPISKYIYSIPTCKKNIGRDFRKRSASQIIESNYVTGCTDKAILLCTLARCAGYEALMVETFKDQNPVNSKEGHVFNKIYFDNEWRIYESVNGFKKNYSLDKSNYLPAAIGMDFSAYYEYKGFDDIDISKTSPFKAENEKELSILAQKINEDRLQKKPSNEVPVIEAVNVGKVAVASHEI